MDKPWDRDELPDLPHPSQAEFRAGRRRRYGQTNPEPIQDPFLEYMVKTRAEPFFLREEYGHKWTQNAKNGENDKTAVWSFCRIGQTTTLYKNRYRIHIGGEHDDFYDPDFLIYNDVLVEDCADKVWIYGYPREVFPPTDFHTATLLEEDDQQVPSDMRNGILIVGGIGYANDRAFWHTPVHRLDLDGMWIYPVETTGDVPGWIHGHRAALLHEGNLLITGGEIFDELGKSHPNTHRFELNLWDRIWKRTT